MRSLAISGSRGEPEVTRRRDEGIAAECQILASDQYRGASPNMTPGRSAGGRRAGPRRPRRAAPRPGCYRADWGWCQGIRAQVACAGDGLSAVGGAEATARADGWAGSLDTPASAVTPSGDRSPRRDIPPGRHLRVTPHAGHNPYRSPKSQATRALLPIWSWRMSCTTRLLMCGRSPRRRSCASRDPRIRAQLSRGVPGSPGRRGCRCAPRLVRTACPPLRGGQDRDDAHSSGRSTGPV